MALTVTEVARGHLGATKAVLCDVTFDSSYPTGGESFTPADVSLSTILAVFATPATDGTDAVALWYDDSAEALQAFETGATVDTPLDEVDDTDSLDNFVAHVLVIGH